MKQIQAQFMLAISINDTDFVLRCLQEKTIDIDLGTKKTNVTPLARAVMSNSFEVFCLLCASGADKSLKTKADDGSEITLKDLIAATLEPARAKCFLDAL